jgi:hypothetical protein
MANKTLIECIEEIQTELDKMWLEVIEILKIKKVLAFIINILRLIKKEK